MSKIRVFLGNPPYSVGQKSANDNAANHLYPLIKKRIKETYGDLSSSLNTQSLHNSYFKAFRTASDQMDRGIVAMITNSGWLDSASADGFRQSLLKEFDAVYVFNLRGNQRYSGELRLAHGGQIFEKFSRCGISISFFVKTGIGKPCRVFYRDIGTYLTTIQKMDRIATEPRKWHRITPNKYHDWIDQRDDSFEELKPLSEIFKLRTEGISTGCDAWSINPSKDALMRHMKLMIKTYNESIKTGVIDYDTTKIKWHYDLLKKAKNKRLAEFDEKKIRQISYRPFAKWWFYECRTMTGRVYQNDRIFPRGKVNFAILVTGRERRGWSCWITDSLSSHDLLGASSKTYAFDQFDEDGVRSNNIYKEALDWTGVNPTPLSVFHWVYGSLHCPKYREKFKNNLTKEEARMPQPPSEEHFMKVMAVGQELAHLHLGNCWGGLAHMIREVEKYGITISNPWSDDYRIDRLRWPDLGQEGSTLIYNKNIEIKGIPARIIDYQLGARPAIKWLISKQRIAKDNKSGLIKDANAFGESDHLFRTVLWALLVCLKTPEIISELPE